MFIVKITIAFRKKYKKKLKCGTSTSYFGMKVTMYFLNITLEVLSLFQMLITFAFHYIHQWI